MRPGRRLVLSRSPRVSALSLLLLAALSLPAWGGPSLGFREDWPGTSDQGWTGGAEVVNPGSGGVDGAADGFLMVSTPIVSHLGTVSTGAEYAGDWIATGIEVVLLWLNDVGNAQPLEIHFSIGNQFNLWQYNVGFHPPLDEWQEFMVDLTSAGNFTQIIGTASFSSALQNVDRIHIRHDLAPFVQTPDAIQGDFGLDRLTLTNLATPAARTSWGRIKRLYR